MSHIDSVQENAGVDAETARRGAHPSQRALGARIAAGNDQPIAVELPEAEAAELRREASGVATGGGIAELAAHAQRHLEPGDDALALVAATFRGLAELLPREVLDHLGDQLPGDLTELLVAQEEGDTSQVHANAPRPGQPGLTES